MVVIAPSLLFFTYSSTSRSNAWLCINRDICPHPIALWSIYGQGVWVGQPPLDIREFHPPEIVGRISSYGCRSGGWAPWSTLRIWRIPPLVCTVRSQTQHISSSSPSHPCDPQHGIAMGSLKPERHSVQLERREKKARCRHTFNIILETMSFVFEAENTPFVSTETKASHKKHLLEDFRNYFQNYLLSP